MYAVPAAHGPSIAATCGTTPLICTCSKKSAPLPAKVLPAASWMRAPAESSSQIIGSRLSIAFLRSRATFCSPIIPIDPAMTVKS